MEIKGGGMGEDKWLFVFFSFPNSSNCLRTAVVEMELPPPGIAPWFLHLAKAEPVVLLRVAAKLAGFVAGLG